MGLQLLCNLFIERRKYVMDVSFHPFQSPRYHGDYLLTLLESSGPFSVAGWLACLGACEGVGIKLYDNCMKSEGYKLSRTRRALTWSSVNTCMNVVENLQYQCPAQQSGLLIALDCPQVPAQNISRRGIDT